MENILFATLIIGTIIFSVSAGLSEVLLSPTIAAIPSDNPQRDMSLLHSLYAFGVFTVTVIATLALKIFRSENSILKQIYVFVFSFMYGHIITPQSLLSLL